jgi:two-component system cell cycle response regulator
MRILIAEDDHTSRTVLAGVLKKNGHDVVMTVNGAEAWQVLQQPDAPRLVILDWMMPEMDGLEVLRLIRSLKTDRLLYVIMLTSKIEKANIIAGLDAGANDYLAKPFDAGELRARIEVGRRMIEMQDALSESRAILAHQATHDQLTGLLNRRAILDRLHEELVRARRYGDVLAVGMVDIDHFKQVNDTYGHQAGDDVLCGFVQILSKSFREYDTIGRIGGEEFLVIAPIKPGTDCGSVFSRALLNVDESKIPTRSGMLTVTMSIGVATATFENSVDEILEAADTALYHAKNEGRNRISLNGRCIFAEGTSPCGT